MVAEISSKLRQYDESGLLDYISINNWIRNALREFGGNIMHNTSTILRVEDGRVRLPDNYYSLSLAIKCEPHQYYVDKEDKKHLQSSVFYTERIERGLTWSDAYSRPCKDKECKYIRENTYFIDTTGHKRDIELYYGNPSILRLRQGHKAVKCEKDCKNLGVKNSPYDMVIQGGYIHTNFNQGNIYLHFRGLPTDEEGELIIPEIQRNKLTEYIQTTCIRRVLEDLLLNSDDPDVYNKWQIYRQLEKETYLEAKNDTVNEGMLGWSKALKDKNKLRSLKYEVMFNIM